MIHSNLNPQDGFIRNDISVRTLKKLLLERDPAFETRIARVASSVRQPIHDALKEETALKLGWNEVRKPVKLSTVEGLPVEFAQALAEESNATVWKLILHQSQISAAVDVTQTFQKNLPAIQSWLGLDVSAQRSSQLESISRLFQDSLSKLEQHPLLKQLRHIDRDILGSYNAENTTIEIYWMPIALFAMNMDVSVETLTALVTAHEYAHAYTQAGFDLDGHFWDPAGFRQSDQIVTEGLAQFYTERVLRRLTNRFPDVLSVFDKFKHRQSVAYKKYGDWLRPDDRHQEIMRSVLVDSRRIGVMDEKQFSKSITDHSKRIGGRRKVHDPLPLSESESSEA